MRESKMADPSPLLNVDHLSVWSRRSNKRVPIVEDVTFSVDRGELVAILGESGSGKTTLVRALTRLFRDESAMEVAGNVSFAGTPIHQDAVLSSLRRHKIRYIFQHPSQALNPTARIKTQLRNAAADNTEPDLCALLAEVGIQNSNEVLDYYPHQLSVGMAQRVTIAMAIMPAPDLLIADEPTSALDTSLKIQLLDLLKSIQSTHGMSMLLVTHSLQVARNYSDRIIVMYAGRIVESSSFKQFFDMPLHPYSRMMLTAHQSLERQLPHEPIMAGAAERTLAHVGCRFAPRCNLVQQKCWDSEPHLELLDDHRMIRCFYWKSQS